MNNLKNENGYVLVVIIGILTILSLMAITFATLSRIETRATRNYTDSLKCEKVAMAALEHAIYEIRLDKFGTDTLAYNDNDDSNPGQYGLDENFDSSGTSWPGNSVFPDTGTDDYDNDKDVSSTDDSTWIYFPATDSSSDIRLPGNLRARYAVLITDDREARINVNVTGNEANGGSHTSNEGWSTFEIDLSYLMEQAGISTVDANNIASDIINERFGTDTLPGVIGDDDSTKIPDPKNDGIDNDGDSIVDEALEDTDEPNEFNAIFPYGDDVPFGILSEAEIMGTTSYESRLETIFNTRGVSASEQDSLNSWVTTSSADTIVCPSYKLGTSTAAIIGTSTATTMLNINALVNNEGAYTNTVTYHSDIKVEMLIDVLKAGEVPDVERQQMAVNIKDFIDSDDTVTNYPAPPDPPEYYGVEKTPYINEIEAEVDGSQASGNGKFIELFNPYDIPITIIAGWTISFGAGPTIITLPGLTIPAREYYVIADNEDAYKNKFQYEGLGIAPDLSRPGVNSLNPNPTEEITLEDSSGNTIQKTTYGQGASGSLTMQLNDPRPTPLMDADGASIVDASTPWRWATPSSQTAGGTNTATAAFDPSVGDDGWDSTTWSPSFIVANRRFSNKGYLGFIHTGSQWTSVRVGTSTAYPMVYPNLLQYITITDPSMDKIDNDGDGDTDTFDTDGDGDIDANDSGDTGFQSGDFDGKEYRIPGLINVNTASTQVLQSLPNIDSAIGDAIDTPGNKPYTSIGDLVAKVPDITGALPKWDEENTFRSISNLITTRSNVFTVYVTAQITDEAISTVYAEKRILAIVDRSVDPIKVRYFRWITE